MGGFSRGVRVVAGAGLGMALMLTAPFEAAAQRAADRAWGPDDSTWGIRAGLAVYGTGDRANCEYLASPILGIEGRVGSAVFVSVAGDVYLPLLVACTDIGTLVPYGDELADEFAGVAFVFTPRASVRAGLRREFGRLRVEPSAGVGLVHPHQRSGAIPQQVSPWAGVAMTLGRVGARGSLELEWGAHRVPVRHLIYRGGDPPRREVVREFHRWEPLLHVGLHVRLN